MSALIGKRVRHWSDLDRSGVIVAADSDDVGVRVRWDDGATSDEWADELASA